MPVLTRLQQIEEINRHPLNQESKRWLRLVPYPVDEDQPYLLQLMWWGLEEARLMLTVESVQYYRDRLLPVIYGLMESTDQQSAWEYLIYGRAEDYEPDDSPLLSLKELQHSMVPEEAAIRALETLDKNVQDDSRMSYCESIRFE